MRQFNGQICKACGREDYFAFNVPDDVWRAIVSLDLRNRVVCLGCFDAFAHQANIAYDIDVLYFAGDQECFTFRRTERDEKS